MLIIPKVESPAPTRDATSAEISAEEAFAIIKEHIRGRQRETGESFLHELLRSGVWDAGSYVPTLRAWVFTGEIPKKAAGETHRGTQVEYRVFARSLTVERLR